MWRRSVPLLILLLLSTDVRGNTPVSLRVSPSVSAAPATVRISVTVERNSANRTMEVVVESATFYRSSGFQLDAEWERRTHQLEYRSLPPGQYTVSAELFGDRGSRASARSLLTVRPPGGEGH